MKIILVFLLFMLSFAGAFTSLQAASSPEMANSQSPSPKTVLNTIFGAKNPLNAKKKSKAAMIYLSIAILFAVAAGVLYVSAGTNTKLWTLALLLGIIGIAFMLLWIIRVMTGGRPLF